MKGEEVKDFSPAYKEISIRIDPLLEDERLQDFVNNYLIPFMQQLQVPVTGVTVTI